MEKPIHFRNHMTGWKHGGLMGELALHHIRTSYRLLQYTISQRACLVCASRYPPHPHPTPQKRGAKLSEHTEQKEEHAAQMVRDVAGQRDRKHHASFKVKADRRSFLIALTPARPTHLPSHDRDKNKAFVQIAFFFPVSYFCSKNSCYINPFWYLKRSHKFPKIVFLL